MSSNFLAPSGAGLRKPTDDNQINGQIVNPPRYAEWGGLSGPSKVKSIVNKSLYDFGMPFNISKPGGGR